jgi:UrcA family protein
MKTVLSTTNLIAAAVIGGAFAAGYFTGPAFAGQPEERTVPFAFDFAFSPDELASTAKAEDLVSRLERRVRSHCGANLKMSVAQRKDATACVEETMKTSISKFGSEAVAQAYKSRAAG